MADLKLSVPIWTKPRETDNLDILFSTSLARSARANGQQHDQSVAQGALKGDYLFETANGFIISWKCRTLGLLPILHRRGTARRCSIYPDATYRRTSPLPPSSLRPSSLRSLPPWIKITLKPCRTTLQKFPGAKPSDYFNRTIRTVLPRIMLTRGFRIDLMSTS